MKRDKRTTLIVDGSDVEYGKICTEESCHASLRLPLSVEVRRNDSSSQPLDAFGRFMDPWQRHELGGEYVELHIGVEESWRL